MPPAQRARQQAPLFADPRAPRFAAPHACGATSARESRRRSRAAAFLAKAAFLPLEGTGLAPLLGLRAVVRLDPGTHPGRELRPGEATLDALAAIHPARRLVIGERRLEGVDRA